MVIFRDGHYIIIIIIDSNDVKSFTMTSVKGSAVFKAFSHTVSSLISSIPARSKRDSENCTVFR